jgi:hypothetical protein
MAQYESRIRRELLDFEAGEVQLAHRGSVRVGFLITRENTVIAPYNAVGARKGELLRLPVTIEESRDVAPIPGLLLGG